MDEKLNNSMIKAAQDAFQQMVGSNVSHEPPVEQVIDSSKSELSVVIGYAGDISGAFILKCSKKMAAKISGKMLGMEIGEDSDDMKDGIGEFFNMLIGIAKGTYSPTLEYFKISVPTTITGKDYTVHIKANNGDRVSLLNFNYDNEPFCIEICRK